MAVEGRLNFVPHFLQAKTPEILRGFMLRNNAKHGIMFAYYGIQFAQNKWWAWYSLEIQNDDSMFKGGDE